MIRMKVLSGGKGEDTNPVLVVNNSQGEKCYIQIDISQPWFRKLIKTLPLGTLLLDRDGTILYSNNKSRELGLKLADCFFDYTFNQDKLQEKIKQLFSNESPTRCVLVLKGKETKMVKLHLMSLRFTNFNQVAAWIEEKEC